MKRIDQVVLVGGDSLQVGITARLQVRHTQPDCILVQLAEAKLLGLFRADPLANGQAV